MFQGAAAGSTTGITVKAQVSVDDCVFQGHSGSAIDLAVGGAFSVGWRSITTGDTFIAGAVSVSSSLASQAGYASGNGYFMVSGPLGGLVTSPPAASAVTLTSGTPWQNTTGSDAIVAVGLAFPVGGGSVAITRGAHGAAASIGTITRPGASGDVVEFYVPFMWDFAMTLSPGVTFAGSATAQPV
jgi:hypothetical protein